MVSCTNCQAARCVTGLQNLLANVMHLYLHRCIVPPGLNSVVARHLSNCIITSTTCHSTGVTFYIRDLHIRYFVQIRGLEKATHQHTGDSGRFNQHHCPTDLNWSQNLRPIEAAMYIKSVLHNSYISLHEVGWVFSLVILMIDGWPQIEKVLRFESLQICSQFQSVTSSQANEFLHSPSPPKKKSKNYFCSLINGKLIGHTLKRSPQFWNIDIFVELGHLPGWELMGTWEGWSSPLSIVPRMAALQFTLIH